MATVLSTVQKWVRFYSNVQTALIAVDPDLEITNLVYQGMFSEDYELGGVKIGRRWAENTREDTSLSTTLNIAGYTWPTSTVFKEEPAIELQTTSGGSLFEPLVPVHDEVEWLRLTNAGNSFPKGYRRLNDAGTIKIVLAPTPNLSSLTIRIRGQIEVTAFTADTDTTLFLEVNSDYAFAKLLASEYKRKRSDPARANELIQEALGLLPATEYMPSRSDNRVTAHYL